MEPTSQQNPQPFIDRRRNAGASPEGHDRRQFRDSHEGGDPDAMELAKAIDEYKMQNRRRFITYEEIHAIILKLGYRKGNASDGV